jgi:hypothetical protein
MNLQTTAPLSILMHIAHADFHPLNLKTLSANSSCNIANDKYDLIFIANDFVTFFALIILCE